VKKRKKKHKNRLFTTYPVQASHTVETTDKAVFFFVQAVHLLF